MIPFQSDTDDIWRCCPTRDQTPDPVPIRLLCHTYVPYRSIMYLVWPSSQGCFTKMYTFTCTHLAKCYHLILVLRLSFTRALSSVVHHLLYWNTLILSSSVTVPLYCWPTDLKTENTIYDKTQHIIIRLFIICLSVSAVRPLTGNIYSELAFSKMSNADF